MSGVEYSPERLAELLSSPDEVVHPPTEQQRAIITAPHDRPALVVAGAGSGKTETMAARVVYLVANRLVAPAEVLGLTFTRKAAGELAERIQRRLDRLRHIGILDGDQSLELPTVATYNAWAGTVYREHALQIGREPDAQVVGEAASWLLARRIVLEHGGPELAELGRSVGQITGAVLQLSNAVTDHVADPSRLSAFVEAFAAVAELPVTGVKKYDGPVDDDAVTVGALRLLLPLVEAYQEAKRRRGVIEFSDQVAAALEICERVPGAVVDLRARHRLVILDEYQDTSVVQARLLARLFAGGGVMAVGDPNQAIYGWRGASASNLVEFTRAFGGDDPTAETMRIHQLTTSWRNPPRILAAANRIADPLRGDTVPVERLEPRPGSVDGAIHAIFPETIQDEADAVADWLRERIEAHERSSGAPPTVAIILRKRAAMERFAEALRRVGVRHRIVGGGGLLTSPEVVDLVAALRVLVDPDAGSALIRLLAGARWSIGLADLAALRELARWLRERDTAQQRLEPSVIDRMRASGLPSDGASIVDALDALVDLPATHRALTDFSETALVRLRQAGAELRRLRGRIGLPLPELVAHVEESLRLDIEVVANATNPFGLGNLRAFRHEVEGFAEVDERASVSSLLAWIDRVADDDREMSPAELAGEPGVVQIITVHGAKGLEWDVVALPRLVESEFPSAPSVGRDWLGFGRLPGEFRGDAEELPQFAWRTAADRREYVARFEEFKAALQDRHGDEERRLAYVAITRTRGDLLLSGSWWGQQQRPRQPSPYLRELVGLLVPELPEAPVSDDPPTGLGRPDLAWPRPALGDRRARVERAAALVRAEGATVHAAREAARPPEPDDEESLAMMPGDRLVAELHPLASSPWAADLALLLAEHAARGTSHPTPLPSRVPASGFKRWVQDPTSELRAILRPMPERPFVATRLGTLFHDWVEARYRLLAPEALFALDDLLDPAEDDLIGLAPAEAEALAAIKATFERSRWANRRPIAIERAIDLPLAGVTIPCKIDAVFPAEDDPDGVVIVDWKTGRRPEDPARLAMLDYQLDLYRLAWSSVTGMPLERIDARLYFVAIDEEYAPAAIRSAAELEAEWAAAVARVGD